MSRRITIVGAGQSGLQLALGLLDHGYQVRIVSNRTPEEIAAGRVASSQCMFDTPVGYEREVGAALWDDAPSVDGIGFTVPHPELAGEKAISWAARLDRPAQSIDQRVKFPQLIELVVARGGRMVYEDAGVDDLERYTAEDDLVLVAAGKGEIARLFERDAERSTFDAPQRALALTYVHGLTPDADFSKVAFNLIPGVGEYFVFPALTLTGPCHIMVFEGVPGGPMDRFAGGLTPEEHLEVSKDILRTFLPWEAERAEEATLTDDLGVLQGRFAPTVRKPIATLPSGRTVLGMADVVVLNDPITGQGSNNASRSAQSYLGSILERGDLPFDDAWKTDAFETYWSVAEPVVSWTNAMLMPPPPHVLQLLGAASAQPVIASRFANGFDDPADFGEWFLDPAGAETFLAEVMSGERA
ncbi:styrene monooxygenase/indole monooxygenase family protein [Herbiconiux sp.]|uniref:styrene monooxygenase/indole monooxygenase family protein n=1 Tax=Herbiconiux sp. TaxID=1871186 RepID=UPI0025B863FA|nr:styrene monooxygenase/indole monooxygenase family protein [Herbiconiux sp.]